MKVKHVNKKAIIIYTILIVVFVSIIILPMGIFHLVDYLSNKDKYIEMNDFEKEVVGIWLMDGAEWHSFSDGSYYYPDGPQGFKKEVAKYCNKTKIALYNEKTKNGAQGELIIGDNRYAFYWTREAEKTIRVTSFPKLSYDDGVSAKTVNTSIIFISNDKSYINISFSSSGSMVYFYFSRINE